MPCYQECKTLRSRREHPASILADKACCPCSPRTTESDGIDVSYLTLRLCLAMLFSKL